MEFLIKRYLASLPKHQEQSFSDKQAIGSPSSKELSAYLSGQLSLFPKGSGVTNLQWNRNKVDFIELFVALYESNSIKASDQHKLTKKEFIQVLMWFFNVKVLDDGHLISEIYCSDSVAPNHRYYVLPELIEANGASIEGRFTDGAKYPLLVDNGDDSGVFDMGKVDFKTLAGYVQNPFNVSFPYDVNISLWLSNNK